MLVGVPVWDHRNYLNASTDITTGTRYHQSLPSSIKSKSESDAIEHGIIADIGSVNVINDVTIIHFTQNESANTQNKNIFDCILN